MGPFKFVSTIFGATANATTKVLSAVEHTAGLADSWAKFAHEATELTQAQMRDELRFEYEMKSLELNERINARRSEAQS